MFQFKYEALQLMYPDVKKRCAAEHGHDPLDPLNSKMEVYYLDIFWAFWLNFKDRFGIQEKKKKKCAMSSTSFELTQVSASPLDRYLGMFYCKFLFILAWQAVGKCDPVPSGPIQH